MAKIPAFGPWTEQDHIGKAPEGALSRAQLAETTPIPGSLDPVNQTARFYGSKVYDVSLSHCPCGGFRGKHPCKHIYRLAMELGIIDLPFKTGVSKGERNEAQISTETAVAAIEQMPVELQQMFKNMLPSIATTSSEERESAYSIFRDASVISQLRQCPLLTEQPSPSPSLLLDIMDRDELRALIDSSGIPCRLRKNASRASCAEWLLSNDPNLSSRLPAFAVFSFSPNFIKAQRSVYTYLVRKFDNDYTMLEDGTTAMIPYGSRSPSFSVTISPEGIKSSTDGKDPRAFYFPDDKITSLLTQYGHNRCLNGFFPCHNDDTPQPGQQLTIFDCPPDSEE